MTRKDLVKSLLRLGLTQRQSQQAVDAFFGSITSALREGKKVSIVGWGAWEWRPRPARKARNPKTGREVSLGVRKSLTFKPSPGLKQKLKKRAGKQG